MTDWHHFVRTLFPATGHSRPNLKTDRQQKAASLSTSGLMHPSKTFLRVGDLRAVTTITRTGADHAEA